MASCCGLVPFIYALLTLDGTCGWMAVLIITFASPLRRMESNTLSTAFAALAQLPFLVIADLVWHGIDT
jgi:hypothetical protein